MRDDRLHPGRVNGNTAHGWAKAWEAHRDVFPVAGSACLGCDDLEVVHATLMWTVS